MGLARQQTNIFGDEPKRSHHAPRLNPEAEICRRVNHDISMRGLTGAMAEEIGDTLRLTCKQVQSALGELYPLGYVKKSEAKRLSRSGGYCTVYIWTGKEYHGDESTGQ